MGSHPPDDMEAAGTRIGEGIGRVLEVVFTTAATLVFVVLWIYIAAAAFTDGTLLEDTWAWYLSFGMIGRIVIGILILPNVVFLWAWQADLEPILFGLVMVGMIAWSFIAFQGTYRALRKVARR